MGKSEAFPGGGGVIYGRLAVLGIRQSCTLSSRARQPTCASLNPVFAPSGGTRRLPVVSLERPQVGGAERKQGSLGEKSRSTLTLTFVSKPELSELSINSGGGGVVLCPLN